MENGIMIKNKDKETLELERNMAKVAEVVSFVKPMENSGSLLADLFLEICRRFSQTEGDKVMVKCPASMEETGKQEEEEQYQREEQGERLYSVSLQGFLLLVEVTKAIDGVPCPVVGASVVQELLGGPLLLHLSSWVARQGVAVEQEVEVRGLRKRVTVEESRAALTLLSSCTRWRGNLSLTGLQEGDWSLLVKLLGTSSSSSSLRSLENLSVDLASLGRGRVEEVR